MTGTEFRSIVQRFNDALAILLDLFSDRNFRRTQEVSVRELSSQTKPDVIWYRGDKMNIAYVPPHTFWNRTSDPYLHVRVYEPEKAEPVRLLLQGMGFKPRKHDNDPYSKVDIDACLA